MKPPSYLTAARRIWVLSLGEMLWSRRTIFMAMVAAAPILVALVARAAEVADDVPVSGARIFGTIMWLLFLRFCIPVVGVFYGTSLIADEVDDKTITYLFTRPVQRGAILIGKYFSYLTCTTVVVLPSIMAAYVLLVPLTEIPAGVIDLFKSLGTLALGLAVYGALFALIGAVLRRPLVIGLVFAFGWEPLALVVPGYLRRFTVAYYLQALMPQAMPADGIPSLLQGVFPDPPSSATSLFCLTAALVVCLTLAARAVERREYVLAQ